jgi:hypothetical protein
LQDHSHFLPDYLIHRFDDLDGDESHIRILI